MQTDMQLWQGLLLIGNAREVRMGMVEEGEGKNMEGSKEDGARRESNRDQRASAVQLSLFPICKQLQATIPHFHPTPHHTLP